jgi:hypothetical protein
VVRFSLDFLHKDLWDNVEKNRWKKLKRERTSDSNVGAVFL